MIRTDEHRQAFTQAMNALMPEGEIGPASDQTPLLEQSEVEVEGDAPERDDYAEIRKEVQLRL